MDNNEIWISNIGAQTHTPQQILLHSIYYTLLSQKFNLQIGFPKNSPLQGNIFVYFLNLRMNNNEIWISNIGAQTHTPQQILTPVLNLAPPYINLPTSGPTSGA